MRTIVLCLFLGLCALTASRASGQAFRFARGSYEQALAQASKEGKTLMVMTTASFSEASTMMVEEVMADEEVGGFFNQHFLGWVLDAEPLAPEFLFGRIHLLNIPEYLFMDAEGEVFFRASGYQGPEEMIEVGKMALDPVNHSSTMQALYQAGKRDPEFMQRYISTMHANGREVREIALAYLASLKPEALLLEPNWKITTAIVDDPSSRECRHILENYERYCEKFDALAVGTFLLDVVGLTFERAVKAQDVGVLRTAHPLLDKVTPVGKAAGIRMMVEMKYHAEVEDWEAYKAVALDQLHAGSGHDANFYNDAATNFYYHVDDPAALKAALHWVEMSIEMDRQAWNLDTKAALLSKLGDAEAAKLAAKEAVDLAGDDLAPVEFSLELLQK